MKRFLPKLTIGGFLLSCLLTSNIFAQHWSKQMDKGDKASLEEAKKEFNKYWKGKTPEKGKGFNVFSRWLYQSESRLMPDGSAAPAGKNHEEYSAFASQNAVSATGNWSNLGPNNSGGGYAGIGRINCIAFHNTDANIIYVGSAGGGVWKSTNGGSAWSPITDQQGNLGASSIIVEPTNSNIIYLATGDGDGKDSPSTGIMKSTDGGTTWATTGLNWSRSDLRYIRKIVRHPTDANTIYAATSVGIFKTTDAGASWSQSQSTINFFDIENKPSDALTYYATGFVSGGTTAYLYRTTDGGATWTSIHSKTNAYRAAVAVSAANANFVGLLYDQYDDDGFGGFYSSTNSGTAFTLKASTPNLFGWEARGNDTEGQGFYDMALAIDPANASIIYVGGVNTWKSIDGGSTWKVNTMWTRSGSISIVHADKHSLEFQNATTLWQTNDGGVYKTTDAGTSWTHLTNPMEISQMYRLGIAQTSPVVIAGVQDNGTKVRSATGVWTDRLGGDGMDCAINPLDANYMYGELYYGDLRRSTNGGSTWGVITPTTEKGAWVTPFALAPSSPSTIYAGYINIWKSTNNGTSWAKKTPSNTVTVKAIAIAPNNANVVYYSADRELNTGNAFFKTTDGGTTWLTMTNPTNSAVSKISSITVDNTDANKVWITTSGYISGNKVFSSTNGGTSWTNVSGTLPNIPANSVVFSNGSNGGIYLGMDIGVYYKDNTMSDWALFNKGLPNVKVADIDIQYSLGKLRIASYGRGVWESDLFGVSSVAARKGVEEDEKSLEKSTFSIYPNPATNFINVEFYSKEAAISNLFIMDLSGRLTQKVNPIKMVKGINQVTIPVSNLPNGIYYLGDAKGKSTRFLKN